MQKVEELAGAVTEAKLDDSPWVLGDQAPPDGLLPDEDDKDEEAPEHVDDADESEEDLGNEMERYRIVQPQPF